jgi:hypothetical protein
VIERQDNVRYPCPIRKWGAPQIYQIECGHDLVGGDSTETLANTFGDCIDVCTSTPSCVGISYEPEGKTLGGTGPRRCYLKSSVERLLVQTSRIVDSAIVIPSDVKDDCDSLEIQSDVNGTHFQKYCGYDYPLNDAFDTLHHAKSLKACMGICVSHGRTCSGVTFEPGMTHGVEYWNCYVKIGAFVQDGLQKKTWSVGSAFVVDNSNSLDASSSLARASSYRSIATATNSPTSTRVPKSPHSPLFSKGAIAGISIGALAGVALTCIFAILIFRRRRRRRADTHIAFDPSDPAHQPAMRRNVPNAPLLRELPARVPPIELGASHGMSEVDTSR